jgi:hypothetical protein
LLKGVYHENQSSRTKISTNKFPNRISLRFRDTGDYKRPSGTCDVTPTSVASHTVYFLVPNALRFSFKVILAFGFEPKYTEAEMKLIDENCRKINKKSELITY